ncbi:MAG TPA: OstA-like protein [Bacteroidota bacterium]|nr:OstA-like protein [Bacteroidota bacterium]
MNWTRKAAMGGTLLVATTFGLTDATAQEGSKVIELRSARELKGRVVAGEEVRELIGNVHFVQQQESGGLVYVWCDRALRYMSQNKMELFGHVRVVRDSVTVTSDEGVYYADARRVEVHTGVRLERGGSVLTARNGIEFVDEKRFFFSVNVRLVDSASTVTSDTMTYLENEAESIAVGNVVAVNTANATTVFGDSLTHYDRLKFTVVLKKPRLMDIDTTSDGGVDTMVVVSRRMEMFQDTSQTFVAIDSVLMARGDLSARCGRATYLRRDGVIVLQYLPVVWHAENQISGDSIAIHLSDRRLRDVYVRGRAMAISRADSVLKNRFDQLTGRELTMYFAFGKIDHIDVERNATSLYYLFDNITPNGANKSSGDRIAIEFLLGKIDRIKVVGGVQGQYFPENMLAKREPDYNLDGFRWYATRPVRDGSRIVTVEHD